jgi:hypothetical protein
MPKRAVFRLDGTQPTMIVGYARTSTTDQAAGLAAQERDLMAAGAERIFGEQVSSATKRVKLAECLAFMREGDVLTVTKLDRLARSTAELLSIEVARLEGAVTGLAPSYVVRLPPETMGDYEATHAATAGQESLVDVLHSTTAPKRSGLLSIPLVGRIERRNIVRAMAADRT